MLYPGILHHLTCDQSQFRFGAINCLICYQKKIVRKNAAIEISAVFTEKSAGSGGRQQIGSHLPDSWPITDTASARKAAVPLGLFN
jgi:hypothetical protein